MFEILDTIKPALRELITELRKEYAYASVLAVADDARSWRVGKSGVSIGTSGLGGGDGFVVRVFDQKGAAEYSFNSFSREAIPAIKEALASRLTSPENTPLLATPIPADEPATLKEVSPCKILPSDLGDEAILAKLRTLREKGLAFDERIMDVIVSSSYRSCRKLFLSENRDLDQTVTWMTASLVVLASRGEEIKDYYRPYSVLGGAEVLDAMEADYEAEEAKLSAEIAAAEVEYTKALKAEEEARRKAEEERKRKEEEEKKKQEAANKKPANGGSNNGGSNSGGSNDGGSSGGSNDGGSSGGSGFVSGESWRRPCSWIKLTSPYGYRTHPTTGQWKFHNGVDLANNQGTPIYAARSGKVTVATYGGTYGYYVTINHGDGYSSLYAHMTHYVVSKGDTVSKGQVIGYMGSTGRSTGPHLHFSIFYNGSSVNPMNYI